MIPHKTFRGQQALLRLKVRHTCLGACAFLAEADTCRVGDRVLIQGLLICYDHRPSRASPPRTTRRSAWWCPRLSRCVVVLMGIGFPSLNCPADLKGVPALLSFRSSA